MSIIKLIIADDHPIFRKGLSEIISQNKDFCITAEAGDGETALGCIKEYEPDIALVDLSMPKINGFELLKELKKNSINVKVIFLTMHKEEDIFNRAVDLGINGYVLKESALEDIIECIYTVHEGSNYFSPQLSGYLLNKTKIKSGSMRNIEKLTITEKKILELISKKLTSQETAHELFISIRTVENHRANICQKLELHGINSLLKYAVENKHIF